MKIAFFHPDLGIGGAERLIIDSILGLKYKNSKLYNSNNNNSNNEDRSNIKNDIIVFTSYHDKNHCFAETLSLHIIVAGIYIPRSIFNTCMAFFAYLRMLYLTIYALLWYYNDFDIVIVDQISIAVPILALFKPVCFYCHYPDCLLTTRTSILKRMYRSILDFFEELTTSYADILLVNSEFTKSKVLSTFKSIKEMRVLYPTVSFNDRYITEPINFNTTMFVSINRFERKKQLDTAIIAFSKLLRMLEIKKVKANKLPKLVIAGGYDPNNLENIEHYEECKKIVINYEYTFSEFPNLHGNIIFYKSFSNAHKLALLDACTAVIYTPKNEHFGIVPLEAMYMNRPVIAHNSGGPLETIGSDFTRGILCNNDDEFANAMLELYEDQQLALKMGKNGCDFVDKTYSFEVFSKDWDDVVVQLSTKKKDPTYLLYGLLVVTTIILYLIIITF